MNGTRTRASRVRAKAWVGSGWTIICRLIFCGIGLLFSGGAVYHYLDQARELSPGLVLLSLLGLAFLALGLLTSAERCEKIAEAMNI